MTHGMPPGEALLMLYCQRHQAEAVDEITRLRIATNTPAPKEERDLGLRCTNSPLWASGEIMRLRRLLVGKSQ